MRAEYQAQASRSSLYLALYLLCAAVTGLLLGVGLDQVFLRHVGHDQSWCIYAADLMLRGVPLDGPTLIEVNPPFIIWFSALPVLVGNLLHIGMLDGFRVFFDAVVLGSLVWTTLLLRRLFQPSALALWLFAMAQVIVSVWLIGKDSLGQREHFLTLFLLPYLVLTAGRLAGRSVGALASVLIGLSAALAICLKPQHLLAVVAVELVLLVRSRSLRSIVHPAVVAFALGLILYGISVFLFSQTYLRDVLPQLRMVYWALNHPWSEVLPGLVPVGTGIVVAWIAFFVLRRQISMPTLPIVLGTAAVGSALAYLQQHKGWSYQLIPAGLISVLFIATILIGLVETVLVPRFVAGAQTAAVPQIHRMQRLVVAALCCLLAAALDLKFGHRAGYYNAKKRELARIYAQYPAGVAVSYIATQPWDMPLVIEQHKVLGQRVNYLWLLPAILRGQDPENILHHTMPADQVAMLSAIERRDMSEDLAHWKPAVVVVDQCGPELCDSLAREHLPSLIAWFTEDPGFNREWSHYQSVGRTGDLETFRRVD